MNRILKSLTFLLIASFILVCNSCIYVTINSPETKNPSEELEETENNPHSQSENKPAEKPVADDVFPSPKRTANIDINDDTVNFFAAKDKYFYKKSDNTYQYFYIKGINIGLTEPTTSLDNPNVSYESFYSWLTDIYAMNINTVRVYTSMNPNFYRAFYDFNQEHKSSPLYLIQGIWFNENYMYDPGDAFDSEQKIVKAFKKAVYEVVDLIHGNSDYTDYGEFSPAVYDKDVSQYVAGYILGLEWPSSFVIATNDAHDGKSFNGEYLYTDSDASPFEAFLCEIGDYLISHEYTNYKQQTPVAFLNWCSTDALSHSNEPFTEEDEVSVDTENILASEKYHAGLFAAIDVYPYYPEFLNHQAEYLSFYDKSGKQNPYRAYLRDLKSVYSVPVMIAEVGLPTTRGISHLSVMGYNQGGLSEEEQGEYVSSMLKDIAYEGYCGSLMFIWQDEWFKRAWNTVFYAPENTDLRTQNMSSAEQGYGVLTFDASSEYADGELDESTKKLLATVDGNKIYADYDSAYLNIAVKTKSGFDFENELLYIPISTSGRGSKFSSEYSLKFDSSCDFLLIINGEDNTRLLTDAYNDIFHYRYAVEKKIYPANAAFKKKNSGIYNVINTYVSNEMYLPDDDVTLEPKYYESGLLKFGNNNPESEDFYSLADFYYKDGILEIRIPWYLLNIVSSAEKLSVDDFYAKGGIEFAKIKDIGITLALPDEPATLHSIDYKGLDKIIYKKRLKKSYYIFQKTLDGFMA